jgi:squalene-associated FAD-dependent desaturase
MKLAVIGAGWAGLAAAVRGAQAGHAVTVFEAAAMPGGRARSDDGAVDALDNGQHILLGGYARTLGLMRDVGVDVEAVLARRPLAVTWPDGSGLALPAGPFAAARGLVGARGFSARDKLSLLATVARWRSAGYRCDASQTVAALLQRTAPRVRERLLEPLCIAALNTPPAQASAEVLLAVLQDSLFGAPGASDLLLPQVPLAQLLPLPAMAWLRSRGIPVLLRRRIQALRREGGHWIVEADRDTLAQRFDGVVLATTATEAARLVQPIEPAWAASAGALQHEPIVTVRLHAPPRPWPAEMLALPSDDDRRPAQFAFRLGAQAAAFDRVSLVVSAAGTWLERGAPAVAEAAVAQYREAFAIAPGERVDCVAVRADRRATFRCTAGLRRPPADIAEGLAAAGDYVRSRYPATLEAAVMAGEAACERVARSIV